MRDVDAAWLAGLYEGEGHIQRDKKSGVTICIGMTDHDVIAQVADLMGTKVSTEHRKNGWKTMYHARIGGDNAIAVILQILPYLGCRRSRDIYDILSRRLAIHRRLFLSLEVGTYCRNGHFLGCENDITKKPDHRYGTEKRECRKCHSEQESRRRQRKNKDMPHAQLDVRWEDLIVS